MLAAKIERMLVGGKKPSAPASKNPYKTLKYLQNPYECGERGCQLLRQREPWQCRGEKIQKNPIYFKGKEMSADALAPGSMLCFLEEELDSSAPERNQMCKPRQAPDQEGCRGCLHPPKESLLPP